MESKSRKKFILLFWIMINIFIIFCISLAFLRVESKTKDYINDKNEFFLLKNKINSFDIRKAFFKSQTSDINIIRSSFLKPGKDEGKTLAYFIKEIEDLATKHGVSLETESITQPTKDTPFYLFSFSISGKFPGILRFIFAIEDTSFGKYKAMSIQKLNIKRVASSSCNEQGECQSRNIGTEGSFELKIYSGSPE